jgi:hypothetical protein
MPSAASDCPRGDGGPRHPDRLTLATRLRPPGRRRTCPSGPSRPRRPGTGTRVGGELPPGGRSRAGDGVVPAVATGAGEPARGVRTLEATSSPSVTSGTRGRRVTTLGLAPARRPAGCARSRRVRDPRPGDPARRVDGRGGRGDFEPATVVATLRQSGYGEVGSHRGFDRRDRADDPRAVAAGPDGAVFSNPPPGVAPLGPGDSLRVVSVVPSGGRTSSSSGRRRTTA